MGIYRYTRRTVNSYLSSLYEQNVGKSSYLLDDEVEEMVSNIGIFKFKGYVYAFKNYPSNYSIDDVFIVYFFDKYLSRVIMDLTSTIETKLKTVLIELCYKQINSLPRSHSLKDNPFFYLVQSCYKVRTNLRGDIIQPKLTGTSVYNWHENLNLTSDTEYQHYSLYYKNNYNFDANRDDYLDGVLLLQTFNDINYPPFHYFMESATLGTVIYLIKNLQINQYDIIVKVARKFGIQNTRRVNFAPYLDRLNEVRNRAAHRERLFNRSYRSVARVGHFQRLSNPRSDHRFIDVYIFLLFMLDELEKYDNREEFMNNEIKRLLFEFKNDYYIGMISKGLTKKISQDKLKSIEDFIIRSMN